MKQLFGVLTIAAALAWAGCKDDQATNGDYAGIDSRLQLQVGQQLESGGALVIHAATERTYNCSNYSIVASPAISDTIITVSFNNIYQPSDCNSAQAPARTDVSLGALASKTYRLALRVNGGTTGATLTVTDSTYAVANGEGQWTTFIKPSLRKVPRNVIWGEGHYNNPNAVGIFRSFTDSLQLLGARQHRFAAADYGFFQVDSAGNIGQPSSTSLFAKSFIFRYDSATTTLRSLVKRYGKSYKDQITIVLYGPRGEVYRSNVLAFEQ